MTDDERLVADLRATLARRDPGGAPARLEAIVVDRLHVAAARPARGVLRWFGAVASVAGIAALALIAATLRSFPAATPAAGPAVLPLGSPFGLAAGDGVVSGEFVPVLQIVVWLVAVAACGKAVTRSRVRSVTVVATLGLVALAWVGVNAGKSDAIVDTGMVATIDPSSDESPTDRDLTVRQAGDQPFRTIIVLTNSSGVPLTLRGLVPTPTFDGYDPPVTPRFVALGRLPDNEYVYDHVVPFEPVTLRPGELVNVELLGMTGACAEVPTSDSFSSTALQTVTLVYEQLTLVHTAIVPLARPIQITTRDPCPQPGSSAPQVSSSPG